jgi:hypothetical protein
MLAPTVLSSRATVLRVDDSSIRTRGCGSYHRTQAAKIKEGPYDEAARVRNGFVPLSPEKVLGSQTALTKNLWLLVPRTDDRLRLRGRKLEAPSSFAFDYRHTFEVSERRREMVERRGQIGLDFVMSI